MHLWADVGKAGIHETTGFLLVVCQKSHYFPLDRLCQERQQAVAFLRRCFLDDIGRIIRGK